MFGWQEIIAFILWVIVMIALIILSLNNISTPIGNIYCALMLFAMRLSFYVIEGGSYPLITFRIGDIFWWFITLTLFLLGTASILFGEDSTAVKIIAAPATFIFLVIPTILIIIGGLLAMIQSELPGRNFSSTDTTYSVKGKLDDKDFDVKVKEDKYVK
tara:strand:+ start:152 stop:628 length:477 start_codon:yes stop_codon:yes gene_type:complete